MHDAQDLTQSFFAYLIERKIYARVDREKGKFRSFLLVSLKNFLGDAYDREKTLKRGGGLRFLPLYEEQTEEAESLFQTTAGGRTNEDGSSNEAGPKRWSLAPTGTAGDRSQKPRAKRNSSPN